MISRVKEIQEWLGLAGCSVPIDGRYGPKTEKAVLEVLSRPIQEASATDPFAGPRWMSPRQAICHYARRHLAQRPREVGGQNRGPWVRLYCKGRDGTLYAWCLGFALYVVQQALRQHNRELPLPWTLSCDAFARSAFAKDLVRPLGEPPRPGDLFLLRSSGSRPPARPPASPPDWTHAGVVVSVGAKTRTETKTETRTFESIEGNTNDEGSREGYEVCVRFRKLLARAEPPAYDFVRLLPDRPRDGQSRDG